MQLVVPMWFVLLLLWLYPPHYGGERDILVAICIYPLALLCDLLDRSITDLVGLVSGHVLEHVLAEGGPPPCRIPPVLPPYYRSRPGIGSNRWRRRLSEVRTPTSLTSPSVRADRVESPFGHLNFLPTTKHIAYTSDCHGIGMRQASECATPSSARDTATHRSHTALPQRAEGISGVKRPWPNASGTTTTASS